MNSIEAHQVGKQYFIARAREHRANLNETLTRILLSPFRRMGLGRGKVSYGTKKFWALQDVSFEVPVGQTVGIIGINGSGKSTLMKIIGNVVRPTQGYTRTRGRVGALLEVNAGFHPELTGRENTFLKGTAMGMTMREIRQRFDEIIEFAEIQEFVDTPVKRYSSGMQVRLGFSIAVKMRPEIFLVDEAFAVGDIAFQEKCLRELETIIADGCTVVIISHITSHITRLCKHVLWLHDGKLVMQGETETVTDAYLNRTTEAGHQDHAAGYFQAPPNTEIPMCITEIALQTEDGQLQTQFDRSEALKIRVKYQVNSEEVGQLALYIRSYDEGGGVVLYTGDADLDPQMRSARRSGEYEAEITLPARTFQAGFYSLNAVMEIPFVETYQRHQNVLDFTITDQSSPWINWHVGERSPGVIGYKPEWVYLTQKPI